MNKESATAIINIERGNIKRRCLSSLINDKFSPLPPHGARDLKDRNEPKLKRKQTIRVVVKLVRVFPKINEQREQFQKGGGYVFRNLKQRG